MNIAEVLISLWTSIMLREEAANEEQVAPIFGGDVNNVDCCGKSLFRFTKEEEVTPYLLYGQVYLLADAPRGNPMTKADEKSIGLIPRLRSLSPLSVVDWDIECVDPNRLGKFNFLRHEYHHMPMRMSADVAPNEELYTDVLTRDGGYKVATYRLITTDKQGHPIVYTNDADREWELVEEVPIPKLTEVPVAYICDRPWLREANEEILRHFNLRSNKDNIQYNQGFDKTFIKGVSGQDPQAIQALTEYTVSLLPETGDAFKLDPVDVSGLERAVAEALENALKVGLNMLRTTPAASKEAPSAQSQDTEKANMFALVDSTLETLENCLNQAINYAAMFKGEMNFESDLEFPRSLKESSIADFTTLAVAFIDKFSQYPESLKDILLKAAKRLDLSEEAIKEIETKVVEAPPTPEEQRQALVDGVLARNAQNGQQQDMPPNKDMPPKNMPKMTSAPGGK
jgi:hypothetical protein